VTLPVSENALLAAHFLLQNPAATGAAGIAPVNASYMR
jgi:hypothetical protein